MKPWNRLRRLLSGNDRQAEARKALAERRPADPVQPQAATPEQEALLASLFGEPHPLVTPVAQERSRQKAHMRPHMGPHIGADPVPMASPPKIPRRKKRRAMRRDDVIIATLGLVLAFTCALFPWYIFFNQEKFGVREFVFSGGREGSFAKTSTALLHPSMEPFSPSELPLMELDFFPTATTVPATSKQPRIVPASQQPFPADLVSYRLVHVANGRAMIEDDDGLWVVQRGSQLPDASHVTAIERRSGEWVLVTTTDKVIKLSR